MNCIISEKGQVTIPKKLRDQLGLTNGTVLHFETDHGKLIATKEIPQDIFRKWRGKGQLPGKLSVDDFLKKTRGC